MAIPNVLNGYPEHEVQALRRLASRNDPDIRIALQLLVQNFAVFKKLQKENERLRTPQQREMWVKRKSKGGRPKYGRDFYERNVIAKIEQWRRQNVSYQRIAQRLNEGKIPSAGGKKWHAQTVMNITERGRKRPK